MNIPSDVKYSETHEWIKVEGGSATIGLTDFAQQELGDIVFVEVPEIGDEITSGSEMGSVESVKAVSEIVAPLTGKVEEFNEALADEPELINNDPYGSGWLIKIALSDTSELDGLMDAEDYKKYVADQEG